MRTAIETNFNNQSPVGGKYAVIYARYSSSGQTEQSIEGQLRICRDYAQRMGYKVINEYVDRAKTGTNANRPAFQNMIADSEKKLFQVIIVYMVDRFARSKEDSVVYKALLRRNGVKVVSATEQIGDSEEGYLVEGLLEMFAEQYSTKLSKRVKNGLAESRIKGNFTGGKITYGYKVIDKKIYIDEEKAPAIRYLFQQYAEGVPKKVILEDLTRQGYRNRHGKKLTINSFQLVLRNTKYIGKYYFNGELVEGYPALIDEETFNKVQKRLDEHKHAPATQKAKVAYLLYGKAFCGHCGANMVGVSGTGRHGEKHYYYACAAKYKAHTCTKKNELKDLLETWIVENIREYILQKSNAARIADLVLAEYKRFINTGSVKDLERQITNIDDKIDNIVELMTSGNTKNAAVIKKLDEKANDLTLQKEVIEAELAKMKLAIAIPHTKEDIIRYLSMFADGDASNPEYRRRIIDRLINSIFIYDDKILVFFNILNDNKITFDMLPELESAEAMSAINNKNPETVNGDNNGVLILSALAEKPGFEPGLRLPVLLP